MFSVQSFYCADTSIWCDSSRYAIYPCTAILASVVQPAMELDTRDSEPGDHVAVPSFTGGTISSALSLVVSVAHTGSTPNYAMRCPVPPSRRHHRFEDQTCGLQRSFGAYLCYPGATAQKVETLTKEIGHSTFQRYNRAWCKFVQVAVQPFWVADPFQFSTMGSNTYAVASFASQYSPTEARNLHSALTVFACFQLLRFEKSLARLKRSWNASGPRYAMFYDVSVVPNQ